LDRQTLLAREVDHRAKNVLAVAQSLIRLSKGPTIDSYKESVDGRLRALSFANVLFSQSRWEGAELRRLIAEELAPYRENSKSRTICDGPDVILKPAVAQNLALCIHELATNAAKYGALSAENGIVKLHWEISNNSLVMTWSELGGPLVTPPSKSGVGSRIIKSTIHSQFGGHVKIDWRPEGLVCRFEVPFEAPFRSCAKDDGSITAPANDSPAKHVLLVEDEPLVAMMMSETLADLGWLVLGPFGSVSAAALALRANRVAVAILDINLGNELVFPLAELLQAKGVPYLFVTGYNSDVVSEQYKAVAVLSKPVDRSILQRHLSAWADKSSGLQRVS